jgi:hypothetical protein
MRHVRVGLAKWQSATLANAPDPHRFAKMSRRSSLPADTAFSPERSAEVSPVAGGAGGRRGVATLRSPSPPPRTWLAQAFSAVDSGDAQTLTSLLTRPGQVTPEVRNIPLCLHCGSQRRSLTPLLCDPADQRLVELLYRAASTGCVAVVDLLLKAGARADVAQSPAVPTPLHACCAALKTAAGNQLAEAGLALNAAALVRSSPGALAVRDEAGRTPVDLAVAGLPRATAEGGRLVTAALRSRPGGSSLTSLLRLVSRALLAGLCLLVLALIVVPEPR